MVSGLAPADAESLQLDLARAAIRAEPRAGESIVIGSRPNAVFSAVDVLAVLSEWFEREPKRRATASIVVERATCRNAAWWSFTGSRRGRWVRRNISPASRVRTRFGG